MPTPSKQAKKRHGFVVTAAK